MKVHMSAQGFELTGELKKYANNKVAGLAKRVPRKLRSETICEVYFAQVRKKGAKFNTCSIRFKLDNTELKAEETTLHMYTALDIATVHVERQLIDFAAKQHKYSLRARIKRHLRQDW